MEDLNSIKVIDTATHKVTATWPIAPGEAASGMAFDLANHRLFIGCDNKLMLMMDSTNGKVVYSVPIGAGVDSNWFDPGTKLAFSSNGGPGTVTIAHEDSPDTLNIVQTLRHEARRANDGARPVDAYDLSRGHRLRAAAGRIEGSPEGGRRHVPRARLSDGEMIAARDPPSRLSRRLVDCWRARPLRRCLPRRRSPRPPARR